LLIGDDITELLNMKKIIDKNFPYDVRTAATFDEAAEILRDMNFKLIVASANMKFVDGFNIMKFLSADKKFSAIPFALATSDEILEVVDKINVPAVQKIS